MATETRSDVGQPAGADLLEQFLGQFEQLSGRLVEMLAQQSANADERLLVEKVGATLREQIGGLTGFVREGAATLSLEGRETALRVVRVGAGGLLVDSGMALTSNLSSAVARFGLSEIFHLIKKIIRTLIKIFKIPVGDWLEPLLDLIDELVDMLLGAGMREIVPELAQRAELQLRQLVQVARLQEISLRLEGEG